MTSLETRFAREWRRLAGNGDASVLAALSGGKDSAALLLFLCALRDKGVSLSACHVHHGIRGKEADRDEAFCRSLCEKLGVPLFVKRADVPAEAKRRKKGLEETARVLRYALLEEAANEAGCAFIATAHTQNDLAETALFHAIRGTGVRGLCGVAPKNGRVLRPLLSFSTEEILSYLKEKDQDFVTDSTNADGAYSRNYLRNTLLPEAEKVHPGALRSLARLAENARGYRALASEAADGLEKENPVPFSAGRARLDLLIPLTEKEAGAPVLYEILSRMTAPFGAALSESRFSAVSALLKSRRVGKLIQAGGGASFCIEGDFLLIGAEAPDLSFEEPFFLHEGRQTTPGGAVTVEISPKIQKNGQNIHKNHLILRLASDKIEGEIFLRRPRPKDAVRMNGRTRSVKKLLSECRVPLSLRPWVPLLCDGKGILWVPGAGLSDRARPEKASEHRVIALSGRWSALFETYSSK